MPTNAQHWPTASRPKSDAVIRWPRPKTCNTPATTPFAPPVLLAFIVSPTARTKVPVREQWLAAGAALGGMLNAAHQLGFGAIVLSGERCFDPELEAALGIGSSEFLAGFLSFGSVSEAPPARKHPSPDAVLSRWLPASGADHPQRMADLAEPGQQMAREFRA